MTIRDLFCQEPATVETVDPLELAAMVRGERGLGGRLKALRVGAGLSIDAVGVRGLRAIETGAEQATPEIVRQVAARTGGDVAALLVAWDAEQPDDARVRLSEARGMVTAALDAGGDCPCCGQAVKVREVILTTKMAVVVRSLVRSYRGSPVKLDDGASLARDAVLWGMALQVTDVSFLPTTVARDFMLGDVKLHRRITVWNGQVLRKSGKLVAWADLKVPPEPTPTSMPLL